MGRTDALMLMVTICQEFGWTYDEYMQQPQYFLELLLEKMKCNQKEMELQAKKRNRA